MTAPTLDDELPPVVAPADRRPAGRRRLALVVLALVMVGVGLVLWQGLGNAKVYFRTADEAVAEKASLGTRRFRVQGVVQKGTVQRGEALRFRIYGERGGQVDVVHRGGQPTGLFDESVPVVLEGSWSADGSVFQSDVVIVKHSETYRSENPNRVEDYGS